jgi:hypothetical protein
MTLKMLSIHTKALINEYPNLKEELRDLYYLACDEVEECGGSEFHECELAISDMEYLIKNKVNSI